MTDKNYLQERLKQNNISDKENTIKVRYKDYPPKDQKIFSQDKDGNIKILYLTPSGYQCQYDHKGKLIDFFRTRLKNPKDNNRYIQPANSGVFPFITPGVITKFNKEKPINTLFIIEGEFKAFSGYLLQLDFIGIAGIHSIKEKNKSELHEYIIEIIKKCKVKNIVLLFDADCLTVEYKAEKDLHKRLNQFYLSVLNFKELLKPFTNIEVYFSHIDIKYKDFAKGLDDLINQKETDKNKLIQELNRFQKDGKYIKTLSLAESNSYKILEYFGLDCPESFYKKYFAEIGENEFIYKNKNYRYDPIKQKLKISWYNQANQYLRVGTAYYKKTFKLNAHKEIEEILQEWTPAEINRDFNNDKSFIDQIPKYDLFCNIPENDPKKYKTDHIAIKGNYQSKQYNRYNILDHKIEPGDFTHIQKFLKHIFSQKNLAGESLYDFGIDYIQLLYTNPLQRLPVLCPVSQKKNTGKSTFLDFLRAIFKENMTILDNERFASKFTSHYIDKLIIAIDETFIEVEKALIKERIKNLCIGKTQWLEAKGRNAQNIEVYSKLILVSNNENNFLQIDEGDNRYAVLKVPELTSDDPNILDKLKKEIPAFLYFLLNRKLKYETGITRFSFSTNVYMTEQMKNVIDRTQTRIQKEFKEWIRDKFLTLQKDELFFCIHDILDELNKNSRYKFEPNQLRDHLKYDLNINPSIQAIRYKIYHINIYQNGQLIDSVDKVGRAYSFKYLDWVSNQDIKDGKLDFSK